jgi:hypothetical protein
VVRPGAIAGMSNLISEDRGPIRVIRAVSVESDNRDLIRNHVVRVEVQAGVLAVVIHRPT